MKSIPFFQSNGIYIAASFSSANSFFFRNEEECKLLHSKLRIYLQGMIDIVELKCFPGGWILIFKSKNSNGIKNAYYRMNKKKSKPRYNDVGHILSEQFRIANSLTVRDCNRLCTRSGSRIHSKIIKMIFDDGKDYTRFLEKLKTIKVFSNQKLKEFYPEFGKIVMNCKVNASDKILENKNQKIGNDKIDVLAEYNQYTEKFSCIINKIRNSRKQYFRTFTPQVVLKLISRTKSKHKIKLDPKFSIFGVP